MGCKELRYKVIHRFRDRFAVAELCKLLEVSRSGYYNVAKANGIKPSMSSVGCPYDNACAESFFSILKTECICRAKPQTLDEAKALGDEYIYFYNKERIQLKAGQTPMEVRYAYAA